MSELTVSFSVPEESCALLISNNTISKISRELSHLLNRIPADRDTVLNAISSQEDGTLPVLLDNQIWLSTSVSAGSNRLILLKSPSKLELEEWLEVIQGGKPGIMTNSSGKIFAMTESANQLFAGNKISSLEDILDSVSMTAFLSASSKCLSGKQVRDFSVLTKKEQKNRKSQVVSLRKLDVTNELLVAAFSSPSMAMSTFERDDSKFMSILFSVIPIPAIKVDEKGIIVAINSHATHLAANSNKLDPVGTEFIDWVVDSDRERVASLCENRLSALISPLQFRAGISLSENAVQQFEMTCLLMRDRENLLVFLLPVNKIDGSNPVTNQTISELSDILRDKGKDEGTARDILEFLRIGTGARGAMYVSKSRRITVGEAALPAKETQLKAQKTSFWTNDQLGRNLTIPVKQKADQAYVKITGVFSRGSAPLGKLILNLAPVLAEYLQSNQYVQGMVKLLNAMQFFMTLLQERERNVQSVLKEIGSIVGADYLAIHTISSKEPILNYLESVGTASKPSILQIEIPSIASWAYTHSEICYVPDTAVDQRFSPIFSSSRSELGIPLVCDGKTMGTLTIGCTRRDAFGYPLGGFLQTIGSALSLWLFKDSRMIKDETIINMKDKSSEMIPGLADLLMSLSYRMRAPVTTLRGQTDLLISEKLGKLTEEQKYSLDSMNTALIDLVEYAERLLNFMKIELSEENLDTSWANPSDVVTSLLPALSEKGRSQNVTVSAELPTEPFTASFDRSRLEQIIGNLVNNAIQYNKPDGSVRIEVRLDGTNYWILEVYNTGEGVTSVDLPNLFDRFFTGSKPGKKTAGLGIGLTIVKSFALQMGGTVNVRSKPGYGTWFTVRLPVS